MIQIPILTDTTKHKLLDQWIGQIKPIPLTKPCEILSPLPKSTEEVEVKTLYKVLINGFDQGTKWVVPIDRPTPWQRAATLVENQNQGCRLMYYPLDRYDERAQLYRAAFKEQESFVETDDGVAAAVICLLEEITWESVGLKRSGCHEITTGRHLLINDARARITGDAVVTLRDQAMASEVSGHAEVFVNDSAKVLNAHEEAVVHLLGAESTALLQGWSNGYVRAGKATAGQDSTILIENGHVTALDFSTIDVFGGIVEGNDNSLIRLINRGQINLAGHASLMPGPLFDGKNSTLNGQPMVQEE